MSSDSDSENFNFSLDVNSHMSNLQEKFLEKFSSTTTNNEDPFEISDSEEPNTPLIRRGKVKKKLPVQSTRKLRSHTSTEPMPSTSVATLTVLDSDEENPSTSRGLRPKRKKTVKKKPVKKAKKKLEKQKLDIHEVSTDEDVVENKDKNPPVLVNILWRSVETKKFAVRKFSNLSVICDHLVKTYNVNPKLLLFTLEDKEIDLKNNTYVSLRLNNNVVIEGGVLPESYLGKENVNCDQQSGIKIKVQYGERKSFFVFLLPEDKLEVIYSEVTKKLNLPFDKFKVKFDGEVVKHSDSVSGLGLEEGDVFDIVM